MMGSCSRFALLVATSVLLLGRPASAQNLGDGSGAGLPSSAALRATVYGPAPTDLAPLPASVPLEEINVRMPWARPVPSVLWFDRRLRAWLSAQPGPAPLVIVISGIGSGGNSAKQSILRGALYGAGYHVLTLPSPTAPGFIVSSSSTGVAGDLTQDGEDLYAAIRHILPLLPARVQITTVDLVGYSLGGANAAMVKALDTTAGRDLIRRVVMINPPVSLLASIRRLDQLFVASIGPRDADIENLYRRLYARLANAYYESGAVQLDEGFLLRAAGDILRTDADLAAAIALDFRLSLIDLFFVGDLYAKTGVVVDPQHLQDVENSLDGIYAILRTRSYSEYFARVLAPYYLQHRPGSNLEQLAAANDLAVIGEQLRTDSDYYAQTSVDDLILNDAERAWLQNTLGSRLAVYSHGGHLGNIGERRQISDLLAMLAGRWPDHTP
ncbi:MAG: hypothetical protein KDI32_06020 [Pseudomonadales bacterium]|nr:hypothetical protein [Pseudomonadales bacterium]